MKKRIFLFTLAFVLLLPSCGKVADPSPVVPSENSSELSVEKTSEEKPSDADAPLSSDASSGEVPTPPQTNELPDERYLYSRRLHLYVRGESGRSRPARSRD